MKTAKLIELERARFAAIDGARDALAAIEGNSDAKRAEELDAAHAKAMRSFDALELDIAEEELRAKDDGERNSQRPIGDASAYGTDSGAGYYPNTTSWRNKDGDPVRVLAPNERVATDNRQQLGLGDLVRAKIAGPRTEEEKRALSEGTDTAGGYTVPAPLSAAFIDRLRARSVAIQAGAVTVPFEGASLAMARLETDPDVEWRAENSALAEGDPTFGRVLFEAKTLAGMIKISRELADDSINVAEMIETAFANAMATKLDAAAIYSDGSANSPTGIVHTSGISTESMGTNGAALSDYDKLIDAIGKMHDESADDPTAQIMHPRTLRALAKLKDGDGNPMSVPEMVAGVPRLRTTSAPIDETQGTATNASSIVFGDFSHLMIGLRQDIEIRVYDQPLASTGQLLVAAWMRADVQLSQPKSFSVLQGITP